MNRIPDTSGISRYWKPGEDDRISVREGCGLSRKTVDAVIAAMLETILSRRRTKLVGFGVFEWRRLKGKKLPTGGMVDTWRLAFKPGRYVRKERKLK